MITAILARRRGVPNPSQSAWLGTSIFVFRSCGFKFRWMDVDVIEITIIWKLYKELLNGNIKRRYRLQLFERRFNKSDTPQVSIYFDSGFDLYCRVTCARIHESRLLQVLRLKV